MPTLKQRRHFVVYEVLKGVTRVDFPGTFVGKPLEIPNVVDGVCRDCFQRIDIAETIQLDVSATQVQSIGAGTQPGDLAAFRHLFC